MSAIGTGRPGRTPRGRAGISRRTGGWLLAAAIAILLLPAAVAAAERSVIGGLRNVEGEVVIVRGGREIFARTGMRVFDVDRLITGDDGSVALVLKDESRIVVGPGSEIALEEFRYDPDSKIYKMTTSVLRGTAQFVTGKIADEAPEAYVVKTPITTIGVRGTRFLVEVD